MQKCDVYSPSRHAVVSAHPPPCFRGRRLGGQNAALLLWSSSQKGVIILLKMAICCSIDTFWRILTCCNLNAGRRYLCGGSRRSIGYKSPSLAGEFLLPACWESAGITQTRQSPPKGPSRRIQIPNRSFPAPPLSATCAYLPQDRQPDK